MMVGEYSRADAFFPPKAIPRGGALKVSGSGYVDYAGNVVSLDDSTTVRSSFFVLAKIPGGRRAFSIQIRPSAFKSVATLTVCERRRCGGQPGWGTRRRGIESGLNPSKL
jgi:hypothetical protein